MSSRHIVGMRLASEVLVNNLRRMLTKPSHEFYLLPNPLMTRIAICGECR